jgi:hypothetical protein
MATTSSGGGVIETVRQQLAAGYSGDAIVDGLIAGGLSRPSAERFVQRAGGQVTATTVAPAFEPPSFAPALDVPPPVPAEYQAASFPAPPYPATSYPAHAHAGTPAASAKGSVNGLKVAGGALLLLIGVGLLALSLSASGRVRLKLPLALVFGGGATLVQAIKER